MITITNADRQGFELAIDGVPVAQLQDCVHEGSIEVAPRHGHSLVRLELVAEHVRIDHDVEYHTSP